MKKEKIKSISHTEKVWWIKIRPNDKVVLTIDKILKKYDPSGLGTGRLFFWWNSKKQKVNI